MTQAATTETTHKISTEELVKAYRGRRVVNGISLDVNQGEIVGLLGPNGAGKTTTFYMIVGLVKPQSGRVRLDGEDITRLPMYKRARAGISYLPQEASVFRNLSVEDNLLLVLEMQGIRRKERRERAEQLMEELHITHRRRDLGKTLSGGERRRVEIARALASEPKFILLDEPFTGVDPRAIEDIETIIYRLTKSDARIGILITDHNVEAMLRITERTYVIADGQKRFQGTTDTLLDDPEARLAYFGERYGQPRDVAREAAERELARISGEADEEELALKELERMEAANSRKYAEPKPHIDTSSTVPLEAKPETKSSPHPDSDPKSGSNPTVNNSGENPETDFEGNRPE